MRKLKPETETLITKIIELETDELKPPRSNPLDKSAPHYRPDWEQMSDDAKRLFLQDMGARRVAWVLRGLHADFEERETKRRRTFQDRLVDLWSRNSKTAWQSAVKYE